MARSSNWPHPAKTWAAEQNPRPLPRIVRLGRPANDNIRNYAPMARKMVVVLSSMLIVLALVHWGLP